MFVVDTEMVVDGGEVDDVVEVVEKTEIVGTEIADSAAAGVVVVGIAIAEVGVGDTAVHLLRLPDSNGPPRLHPLRGGVSRDSAPTML